MQRITCDVHVLLLSVETIFFRLLDYPIIISTVQKKKLKTQANAQTICTKVDNRYKI